MKKSFRDFLAELDAAGELQSLKKPVDVRDVSGLIEQSPKALMFDVLKDYPGWRLAGGLITSRKRLSASMGITGKHRPTRAGRGFETPTPPVMVDKAPCQEVVQLSPDLSSLPYPLMHVLDGGPYISATFVV